MSGRSARHKQVAPGFASPGKTRSQCLSVVGDESARRRGVIIMAYRAAQSEDNKSDHHKKNWTFLPIVPFCLGGLCREPDVSGRQVRPVVLISPGYGRGGRRPAPDMAIVMMYVVTNEKEKGIWTE
uniref:Methylaspartate ammonia-lyase n=1 Tax=Klebsiella pneumoniae TaxID=573 RepID=A0A223DQH0_KLEPN|nr:Methylaspartate ammonia-lyase [Klebsiella pneumoniae]